MVFNHIQLVAQCKENAAYTKPVRNSIEYIVANLHGSHYAAGLGAVGALQKRASYIDNMSKADLPSDVMQELVDLLAPLEVELMG